MTQSREKKVTSKVSKKNVDMKFRIPLSDNHPNHEQHLCSIVAKRKMKTAARLAKDAQYICLLCGRSANKETNLCWPIEF
jgi:hypothetical protein